MQYLRGCGEFDMARVDQTARYVYIDTLALTSNEKGGGLDKYVG